MDQNICLYKINTITNYPSTDHYQPKQSVKIQNQSFCEEIQQENSIENYKSSSSFLLFQTPSVELISKNIEKLTTNTELEVGFCQNLKVHGKQSRKKKIGSLEQILIPYLNYKSQRVTAKKCENFMEYARRKTAKFSEENESKIDLGVCNLREVVEYCVEKKIISNEAYLDFVFGVNQNEEEVFVGKLNKKQLDSQDFKKHYFTPFDHRVLTNILSTHFPNQFQQPNQLLLQTPNLTAFYAFLYCLPQQEYQQICEDLNQKYCRIWMPKTISEFLSTVDTKIRNRPKLTQEESFPFHLPLRKLRKKF